MKTKQIIMIFIVFVSLFIFNNKVYAGTQKWNSLDYNVNVNSDGSMDVVETWNIYISETNTLFKDFELDNSKYSGITNVEVYKVENNEEIPLKEIFEEEYHVTPGCYYGLQKDYNTFEIAWNVGLDNSSANRIYKIYYKVENAIKIYNDCTELYWMFLSEENGISGKNITGTIKLPQEIKDIEKLRVWAHGDLSGEIQKQSNDTIVFSMPAISTNSMLEVRVVTEENIYEDSYNFYNNNMLDSILQEEKEWADQANREREIGKFIFLAIIFINILILVLFIFKFKKYFKEYKEIKKYSFPKSDMKYYREIPNEKNTSPAKAAYLYYFKNETLMNNYISKIFSATILDLTLKGVIELEPIDNKNVKIKITDLEQDLSEDEKIVYDLLEKASTNKEITTKEFEKYSKKHYESFYNQMKKISKVTKECMKSEEKIDASKEALRKKYNNKIGIYIGLTILFIMLWPVFSIIPSFIIGTIACFIISIITLQKINILTEKGYEERNQWVGLKNYMQDFSLLKDKEVPDLILWEKYLVYATAFGISKKVIEQLKVVYPEILNEDTYIRGNYRYMYFASNPDFGSNFMNMLDNSFTKVYSSAASAYSSAHSSSSGGGGGFSSGGGGGRRRWKLWWTLK